MRFLETFYHEIPKEVSPSVILDLDSIVIMIQVIHSSLFTPITCQQGARRLVLCLCAYFGKNKALSSVSANALRRQLLDEGLNLLYTVLWEQLWATQSDFHYYSLTVHLSTVTLPICSS